jgi:hypothetical protein
MALTPAPSSVLMNMAMTPVPKSAPFGCDMTPVQEIEYSFEERRLAHYMLAWLFCFSKRLCYLWCIIHKSIVIGYDTATCDGHKSIVFGFMIVYIARSKRRLGYGTNLLTRFL